MTDDCGRSNDLGYLILATRCRILHRDGKTLHIFIKIAYHDGKRCTTTKKRAPSCLQDVSRYQQKVLERLIKCLAGFMHRVSEYFSECTILFLLIHFLPLEMIKCQPLIYKI